MEDNILKSLNSTKRVEGLTHNFYRYPARFSPEFTREIIETFSDEGDCILDAFMGGGTTIVEAIAGGRKAIGIDINPLAHFISSVKTTPLSSHDHEKILYWAEGVNLGQVSMDHLDMIDPRLKNLTEEIKAFFIYAISTLNQLDFPRQRRFARCALLKVGQWAIDCRKNIPDINQIKTNLLKQMVDMFEGLDSLVQSVRDSGMPKNKITGTRILYLGTINDALHHMDFTSLPNKPKLVLTSPPYPGVHVLYHRWQVSGRRETPVPYFLADLRDGHGESYYTLGGRSVLGLKNYFVSLTNIFRGIHQVISTDAIVVQLVAFSDPDIQLPAYLNAMYSAGYEELTPLEDSGLKRPQRKVPNRKWYTYGEKNQYASSEILLFHRPRM